MTYAPRLGIAGVCDPAIANYLQKGGVSERGRIAAEAHPAARRLRVAADAADAADADRAGTSAARAR